MSNNNLKPPNILSQLPSIIILSSLFWLQPTFAEKLEVTEGANQVIPAGQTSENIRFKLLDDFGNPLTNGTALLLGLLPPSKNSEAELVAKTTITDKNGEIITYLSETDTLGTYTVTAQLGNDKNVSATTYIFVTDPLPALPSLSIGGAMDAEGTPLDTYAEFQGGSSIDGEAFSQNVTYQLDNNSSIFVKGIIQVDSEHLNQEADIIVVALISNLEEEIFCMLNELTICEEWDGEPKSLKAFKSSITLPKELSVTFSIPLWAGNFVEPNTILGYFGYRLNNGTIVFNQQPIEIIVNNSDLIADNNHVLRI